MTTTVNTEAGEKEVEEKVAHQSHELVITRVLDAPREKVWQAWSEARHLAQWWGPKGSTVEIASFEFRLGGVFHYNLQTPDGGKMWGKFVYREIEPPERLVYVTSFADESGNVVRAPFSAAFPLEILNTMTLTQSADKTTMTLRGGPINATEEETLFFQNMHPSMQQGFGGMIDVLVAYLATS